MGRFFSFDIDRSTFLGSTDRPAAVVRVLDNDSKRTQSPNTPVHSQAASSSPIAPKVDEPTRHFPVQAASTPTVPNQDRMPNASSIISSTPVRFDANSAPNPISNTPTQNRFQSPTFSSPSFNSTDKVAVYPQTGTNSLPTDQVATLPPSQNLISSSTNSSVPTDLQQIVEMLKLVSHQQEQIIQLLRGNSISSGNYQPNQITINTKPVEPPVVIKRIPVYYNSPWLDDWVVEYLSDLAKFLNLPVKFEIIETLPTKQEPLAIYLFHVTGRPEEFVKPDRLQNFRKAFNRNAIIILRQGTQAEAFQTISNLFGFDCLSLYYYEKKASMLEKSSAHLEKLKNLLS